MLVHHLFHNPLYRCHRQCLINLSIRFALKLRSCVIKCLLPFIHKWLGSAFLEVFFLKEKWCSKVAKEYLVTSNERVVSLARFSHRELSLLQVSVKRKVAKIAMFWDEVICEFRLRLLDVFISINSKTKSLIDLIMWLKTMANRFPSKRALFSLYFLLTVRPLPK